MLFNSWEFLFLFLPITVCVFALLPRRLGMAWLVVASLFFYGYWNPIYVPLLVGLSIVNYSLGVYIHKSQGRARKALMIGGVSFNVLVIAYFKYADFLISTSNTVFDTRLALLHVALPLAISFFTFQKIAFLVEVYQGEAKPTNFLDYLFFVTFFPQLISGPITLYPEIVPQLHSRNGLKTTARNLAVGLTIFVIGLAKKVIIADGLGVFSDRLFNAADAGMHLTLFDAWFAAFSYTFQLYFDFSGYADMAIGAARMFGIKLPLNFDSPYKSLSIIEFWRRWHMTLSRFLRTYLYIPLGGNRKGPARRYVNLMATMLIGGLWHGAGWNFVLWGGLHGIYLVINHAWQAVRGRLNLKPSRGGKIAAWTITFLAVVLAWVFFRAHSFRGATEIISAMAGGNGLMLPWPLAHTFLGSLTHWGVSFGQSTPNLTADDRVDLSLYLLAALIISVAAPNTQQIMARYRPALGIIHAQANALGRALAFRLSPAWASVYAALAFVSLYYLSFRGYVEFVYRFF